MALIPGGIYCVDENTPYDYEANYYLDFQIFSALKSLDYLNSKCEESEWKNKCQYYHYYTDHLLYSIGQISNRFIIGKFDNSFTQNRKNANRRNFEFDEDKYPIISDKSARNMVEHIDERNQDIIKNHNGVGGFCLIDVDTNSELVDKLKNKKATQPYTLDLINKELLIRNKEDDLVISLDALRTELATLQKSVQALFAFVIE